MNATLPLFLPKKYRMNSKSTANTKSPIPNRVSQTYTVSHEERYFAIYADGMAPVAS